jgi:hypothetical protein
MYYYQQNGYYFAPPRRKWYNPNRFTARAAGLAGDRWEMRELIGKAVETSTFHPADSAAWQEAYARYRSVTEQTR